MRLNPHATHATPPMDAESPKHDGGRVSASAPLGRLRKRAEFQRVSRGRRKFVEAFALQSARREESESEPACARVGLTVTKKVGNSVVRNRIRRRLKEALRAAEPLETRGDHDYVLMARREALSRRFDALVGDLRGAFRAVARGHEEGRGRRSSSTATDRDRRT
jgi:ribonuclease P protein component